MSAYGNNGEVLQTFNHRLNAKGDSEAEITYISPSGLAFSSPGLGARLSAFSHSLVAQISGASGYSLQSVELDALQKAGYYQKKLTYVSENAGSNPSAASYTLFNESASSETKDIVAHPDFPDWSGTYGYDAEQGWLTSGPLARQRSYLVANLVVTKMEFDPLGTLTSKADDLNTVESPGGGYGGEFLVVETNLSESVDGSKQRTTIYQRSDTGWPALLYEGGS